MPAGLQIFDANGNVVLDTNDRMSRVLGSFWISASGSLTHGGLTTGQPFAIFCSHTVNSMPRFQFSGASMWWDYPWGGSPASGYVVFGVY
ncbi:hypothetical protein [Variovorax paradoxus]|uniref:hypothetical protein n=1 Tax=Variovorax paradoxus TaxID=34073 RepID=UPI001ABC48FA